MSAEDEERAFAAVDALRLRIGANIRHARKSAEVSQEQLAERLQVYPNRVSDWERGRHQPSPHNLQRIALALGVADPGWFYLDHGVDPTKRKKED